MNLKKNVWKIAAAVVTVALLFVLYPVISGSGADALFKQADARWNQGQYKKAKRLFQQAREQYEKTGDVKNASRCLDRIYDVDKIYYDFPFSREDLKRRLKKQYPGLSQKEFEKWLSENRFFSIKCDGQQRFFRASLFNLRNRYPDVRKRFPESVKEDNVLAEKFLELINRKPGGGKSYYRQYPFLNPTRFTGLHFIRTARSRLPEKGVLKIWMPYPVQTEAQTGVTLVRVSPEGYWKLGPQTGRDVGAVYFEIPLQSLKKDLNLEVQYVFTRYEQRYHVDPDRIGKYAYDSHLYKRFTASGANVVITDSIKAKARKIIGGETNPYRQARLIYENVVDEIGHGFVPYYYLDSIGRPVSQFVEKARFGDSCARAVYFCALCRSVGIPARCVGGYKLWDEEGGEGHFWAEFFLPDYGWIPVDPTFGRFAQRTQKLQDKQKKRIRNYYFGNLDPYRIALQRDVDVPVYPKMNRKPYVKAGFQDPMAEYEGVKSEEIDTDPSYVVLKNYDYYIRRFDY